MGQQTDEERAVESVADGELLARTRDHRRDAFDALYKKHVRSVYAYTLRMLRDSDEAEEVVQDVFITAWERAASIRLVDESVLPWLLTTARFKSFNTLRRRRADTSFRDDADLDLVQTMPSSEEHAETRANLAMLKGIVDSLSERDRQLVELCLVEKLSYADAARLLGTSHGAVRNRLSRLRASLRSELRQLRGN